MGDRRVVIPVIVGFLILLGGLGLYQEALGYENESPQREYLDFPSYTGNRLMVFNDSRVDYCITDNEQNPSFNDIAVNAVKTWHDRIVDVTQNSKVWDMTMHVYPQDESICDGYVNYYDTPNPKIFQLSGVAGFSHSQTPVANVTIYTDDYQSKLLNMAEKDENFWNSMTNEKFQDIVKSHEHKQFDTEMIKRITLHEIGHSLSLNHPVTSDGDLQSAPGIMGYNMSNYQIDNDEVVKIVKAYPNGFSRVSSPESIKLDNPNSKKTVHLGEVTNLTIELPHEEGKLPPSGLELYIFPEGTTSQNPQFAPIKILKTDGLNHLVNDEEYLADLHVSMTHWDTFTKVLSIQFKVVKEFENADIIVVAHSVAGFEKQWFLNDVLTVDKALFSNLLLDLETTDYTYHLMSVNPNRDLEKESAFKIEQKKLYFEALRECLTNKNMKKCTGEVKFEDFKKDKEPVPIWMPITSLTK